MDKETLSHYGWIVVLVLILSVMMALATPLGEFIAGGFKATYVGFGNVRDGALDVILNDFDITGCEHKWTSTTTATCTQAGKTTYTCTECGKTYDEDTKAGHQFDNASDMTCNKCSTKFTAYSFKASDYDSKMGTTTATDVSVVVPETFVYNGKNYKTTSLAQSAFENCTALTSIHLPDSITGIYSAAFNNCTSLVNINLGECTIEYIATNAFRYCTSLTSIDIPKGITSIGESAFHYCAALTSIDIPEGVTIIGRHAFDMCTSLTNINYGGSMESWGKIKLQSFWKDDIPAAAVHCSDGDVTL